MVPLPQDILTFSPAEGPSLTDTGGGGLLDKMLRTASSPIQCLSQRSIEWLPDTYFHSYYIIHIYIIHRLMDVC